MSTITISDALKSIAPDLTKGYPRSPRETLAGYILAARILDKCRAVLAGTNGEYNYNCPLDRFFFDFTEVDADAFQAFVATGAQDDAVAAWITEHAKQSNREEVIVWNNRVRDMRPSDMPTFIQVFMEDYIPQHVPKGKIVYHALDMFDYEEKRL